MSQQRDKNGQLVDTPISGEHLDANGRIVPYQERDSLRRQIAARAANDANFNRRQAEAAKTPAARRVELFARQAAEAHARGDNKLAEMYENQLPALRAERQDEVRREQFDADPRVQATLKTRQQLVEKGRAEYEGAWEVDLQTAIATTDSRHNYDSPEMYLAAFHESVEKIGRDSLIHRQQVASEAAVTAAEAGVKASQAQVAALEAERRLMTGGSDVGP